MTLFLEAGQSPEDHIGQHDRSFADIVERLFATFEDRHSLTVIVETVRESKEHLRGSPVGALPELIERLAYERLSAMSRGSGRVDLK